MTYPTDPPYSYSSIADFVFDQVFTYTAANKMKENTDQLASSFVAEHSLDYGDHGRISEGANLVINPTARRGCEFWWDGGAAADYNTPGTDVDQADASYAAPNFGYEHHTDSDGFGPYFTLTPASSFVCDLSEKIPVVAGKTITLSALLEIDTVSSAGSAYLDVVCFDSSNKFQGAICKLELSADTGGFILMSKSAATPAGSDDDEYGNTATADTAYVRVRRWADGSLAATAFRVSRIRLEHGDQVRFYSDESSMPQYLSARYNSDNTLALTGVGTTVIKYEDKVFDSPGNDRYSTSTGVFTADRYMRLRVSAAVEIFCDFSAGEKWRVTQVASISIFKTPIGGGGSAWSNLDNYQCDVETGADHYLMLSGSDIVELNEGEKFSIRVYMVNDDDLVLSGDNKRNYLSIEEI